MTHLRIEPRWFAHDDACLRFDGELDLATLHDAETALLLIEAAHPRRMVLDLRGLDLIDSSGLRVLVEAERRSRAAGRQLAVAAEPGGAVHRLLRLTLLTGRISVVADPSDGRVAARAR